MWSVWGDGLWGDSLWGEGFRSIASAQPNLPEPTVDEPPPDPNTDDDYDDDDYDGVLLEPTSDDMWGGGFGIVTSSRPNLLEPSIDEPPPLPDDENEDTQYNKENEINMANLMTPLTSPDKENDFYSMNALTPPSGSSKSSLSYATALTPASERQVALYTEGVALNAGQHCYTNYGRYNHLCFPIPEDQFHNSGQSIGRREPLLALSPQRVIGAYVGRTPERAASAAGNAEFYAMANFLKAQRPLKPVEERQLLRTYGYRGINRETNKFSDPLLSVWLAHHFERAGFTWYELKCSLRPDGAAGKADGVVWVVHRRLAMLRRDLHDPIKMELGKVVYAETFEDSRFPSRGGVPGTSARLKKWLATLAEWVNSGNAPSVLIAHVLKFLELPAVDATRFFFDRLPAMFECGEEGEEEGGWWGDKNHALSWQYTPPAHRNRVEHPPPAAASLSKRLFPDDEQDSEYSDDYTFRI